MTRGALSGRVGFAVACLAAMLPSVRSEAANPDAEALVRRLLAATDEGEQLDLLEKALKEKPDPEDVVRWVAAGRPAPSPLAKGWQEGLATGPDRRPRPFLLFVPESYDPSRRSPLLLALHDAASHAAPPADREGMKRPWEALAGPRGFLVALPLGRFAEEWWTPAGAETVLRVLAAVKRVANVDEDRVFAGGTGDGASGCLYLAMTNPTPFAGFLAAGGHPMAATSAGHQVHLRSLLNKPLFLLSGEGETAVPWASLRPLVDALARSGGAVVFREAEGGVPAETVLERKREAVAGWLAETRRRPAPRKVFWEGAAGTAGRVHWLRVREVTGPRGQEGADLDPEFPALAPVLGVSCEPAPDPNGVRVQAVARDSPAASAGLRAGDLLTEVCGRAVRDGGDLRAVVSRMEFGSPFILKAKRAGESLSLTGMLAAAPPPDRFPRTRLWGTVVAEACENVLDVRCQGVRTFELFLLPGLVDLQKPVVVRVNGRIVLTVPATADAALTLEQALADDDRAIVCRSRIVVDLPSLGIPASASAAAGALANPVELEVRKILERTSGPEAVRTLLEFVAARRAAGASPPEDLGPAYVGLLDDRLSTAIPKPPTDLAYELLKADPGCPSSWSVLQRVREVSLRSPPLKEALGKLRRWAERLRGEIAEGTETRLGLDLLVAWVCIDEGDLRSGVRAAGAVLMDGRGSPAIQEAAKGLSARAGLRDLRTDGPPFRLPTADPARPLTLEEFRGRCVLLLFDAFDVDGIVLRAVAQGVANRIPPWELSVVCIPLSGDAVAASDSPVETAWSRAAFGEEAKEAARAYGTEGRSSLFLVSPAGQILANGGWDVEGAEETAAEQARAELGTPIADLLSNLETSGWDRFRRVWKFFARDRRPLRMMIEQAGSGDRAAMAVRLAAAARGEKLEGLPLPESSDLHALLAGAWCEAVAGVSPAAWAVQVSALAKPQGPDCLAIVDAIRDLGLDRPLAREALETPARRAEDWRVASVALRALAAQDTDTDPSALLSRAQDKRWQMRLALAEALGGYRHERSVDALVSLLGDACLRVRAAAAASLESLTGQAFGSSKKRWEEWRRREGKAVKFVPRSSGAEFASREKQLSYAETTGSYFGLKIPSNRVAFVLDKSESMYYGLFDGAVGEFVKYLTSAGPTTSFAVIEFDAEPRMWATGFVPANPPNIDKAAAFLRAKVPRGPTNIMDSLALALGLPQVDTVILLSDGLPNKGARTDPAAIVAEVAASNRYNRIALHTLWVVEGRVWDQDKKDKEHPPIDEAEKKRRQVVRDTAREDPLGELLMVLAERNEGTFSVAFADSWRPPPGTTFGPSTDK